MAEAMRTKPEWVPEDTFGSRLAVIRQAMGWNQAQAGEACGIDSESWRGWEKGRSPRNLDQVARKIADATGCSYVWLMVGAAGSRTGSFRTPLLLAASNDTPEPAADHTPPTLHLVHN